MKFVKLAVPEIVKMPSSDAVNDEKLPQNDNTSVSVYTYTVKCRYNAVQYNTTFNTALHRLGQDINQCEITNYTPYLALTGELWGVFCEDRNWLRYNDTALYMEVKIGRPVSGQTDR